jgi:hypothetical protein
MVWSGFSRFYFQPVLQGLDDLAPSHNVAWRTFAVADDVLAGWLKRKHLVETGNGIKVAIGQEKAFMGRVDLAADFGQGFSGDVAKVLVDLLQNGDDGIAHRAVMIYCGLDDMI